MLELYVAFKDYDWMMGLVERMLEAVAVAATGSTSVPRTTDGEAVTLDFSAPFKRVAIFDAIAEATGTQRSTGTAPSPTARPIADLARQLGVAVDASMGAGKLVDEVFGAAVEPTPRPAHVRDRLPRRALAAGQAPPLASRGSWSGSS